MAKAAAGFTLIELLAVLVLLGILAVVGLVRVGSLGDRAREQAAWSLTAAAQSQLSLEYAYRVTKGQNLNIEPQAVCDKVAISATDGNTNLVCSGALTDRVTITGTVEGVSAPDATWISPQSSL